MKTMNLYGITHTPGDKYQPSNGSEGSAFESMFCNKCTKEDELHQIFCDVHTAALILMPDEPDYPKEWVYAEDGYPTCTAFEERD